MKDQNIVRDTIMITSIARILKIPAKKFAKEAGNMEKNLSYLLEFTKELAALTPDAPASMHQDLAKLEKSIKKSL